MHRMHARKGTVPRYLPYSILIRVCIYMYMYIYLRNIPLINAMNDRRSHGRFVSRRLRLIA